MKRSNPGFRQTARRRSAAILAVAAASLLAYLWLAGTGHASPQQPQTPAPTKNPETPPLFPIRLNGQFGYMDRTGKIIVRPQFQNASDFHDGMAQVSSPAQGRGIVDATGKITLLSKFVWIGDFSEGLAEVEIWDGSGKAGYIDVTGALVIPAVWSSYEAPTSEPIMPEFWRKDRNSQFSEGLAAVRAADGKFGYINRSGEVVIPPQFLYARPFSEGLAAVANEQLAFGYIDPRGKVVIPLTLQNIYPGSFSEGLARVRASQEITYVDHKNNPQVVVKTGFYFAGYDFHDGMAKIGENTIWFGFIDRAGRIIAEPHYRYATDFSEGFAAVVDKDGSAGYINPNGDMVIPLPKDSYGCPFRGGLARVLVYDPTTKAGNIQHHAEMAYLDKSGKFIVAPSVHTRTPLVFSVYGGLSNCD